VDRALEALTRLAMDLQRRVPLDELLQRVVQGAAAVVGAPRASIRLLDPSGTRLMAVCRAGEPFILIRVDRLCLVDCIILWFSSVL
jgi:hypothetical protein